MAGALGGRELVKRQRHLPAVEIDLDHAVDRFADDGELVECGREQAPLQMAIDDRYQNDETSMQGLGRIELPEVARVVGNEDEIGLSGIANDIPVFPPARPMRATCWASWPDTPATATRSTLRHSSIRNLTTPRWCRASGG